MWSHKDKQTITIKPLLVGATNNIKFHFETLLIILYSRASSLLPLPLTPTHKTNKKKKVEPSCSILRLEKHFC